MRLNKSITLIGTCAAFIWVACTGDSDNSVGTVELSADLPLLKLDDAAGTISFFHDRAEELCILDTVAKTASWKTIVTERDTTFAKAEFITLPDSIAAFIRDSLNVPVNGNTAMSLTELPEKDYYEDYSLGLYVGGKSSSIRGAWVSVPCEVDGGNVVCYNRSDWHRVTLMITANSIHASGSGSHSQDDFGDYTDDISQSGFIVSLYAFMSGVSSDIEGGYGAFYNYSEGMDEMVAEFDIDVKSKSKNAETFVMDGKTYELKADRFDVGEDEVYIDLSISANGKSCTYYHERAYLDDGAYLEKACKSELFNSYEKGYAFDKNGRRYAYASKYEKENGKEFKRCLETLIGDRSGSVFYSSLERLADSKKFDTEFWREYNRNMRYLQKKFK